MVFCNMDVIVFKQFEKKGHNPYFNRWFSAISYRRVCKRLYITVTILILIDGFLQYHNDNFLEKLLLVTILILIDGFLQ